MFNKFQVIVTQMKKKPYDYLDQRKMEFDSDFEDFKRQINDLHVSEIYSFQYKGRIYRSVPDPEFPRRGRQPLNKKEIGLGGSGTQP